jgi:hypothetical protein
MMHWFRRLRIRIFGCPECKGAGYFKTSAGDNYPCIYCKSAAKKVSYR